MTGQAQAQKFSAADFKTEVCKRIYGLFDCANGVCVDVKTYSSFSAVTQTPVTAQNFNTGNMAYTPGDVGDIVVVSLYYQWPIYVSMLGNKLDNLSGGKRLLAATSVFRVEPYSERGRHDPDGIQIEFDAALRSRPARRFRGRVRAGCAGDDRPLLRRRGNIRRRQRRAARSA